MLIFEFNKDNVTFCAFPIQWNLIEYFDWLYLNLYFPNNLRAVYLFTDHSKKIKLAVHELIKGAVDIVAKFSINSNSAHSNLCCVLHFQQN